MKTGRASETSKLIARGILLADRTPSLRPLLLGDSADLSRRLLRTADGSPGWFERGLDHPTFRAALLRLERFVLPGALVHWLARKQLLDAHAQEALAAGCSQIVVLGAGLDTLAWRLRNRAACFELDHPETQAAKRRTLAADVTLAPVDLMHESAPAALRALANFDSAQPTMFVAEGLLMYLAPGRVERLFEELASVSAPGSRFAFSFMEARPGRSLAFHNATPLIDWWLRWRGEPFRWGLERSEIGSFAARHGWRLAALSSPEELRSRFLAPRGLQSAPLAIGESVALVHLAAG